MNDKNFEIIEKLNEDYINIKNSNEYLLGLRTISFTKLLKGFHFTKIINKLILMKRFNRLSKPLNNKLLEINNNIDRNSKIVVYTCIVGNYDKVIDPLYIDKNIDYILFSDKKIDSKVWKNIVIPQDIMEKYKTNTKINRYYKMNPHEVLKKYDYSIYIDGNIQIVSDITKLVKKINNDYGVAFHYHSLRNCIYTEGKACIVTKRGKKENINDQLYKYKNEGFPKEYGMLECGVIVCDLNSDKSRLIMNSWWKEFQATESGRDQLALPYVLWKQNIKVKSIATLGLNLFKNPIIRIEIGHKKKENM